MLATADSILFYERKPRNPGFLFARQELTAALSHNIHLLRRVTNKRSPADSGKYVDRQIPDSDKLFELLTGRQIKSSYKCSTNVGRTAD